MLTKIDDWCNDSVAFFRKEDASRVPSLHKAIAKSIEKKNGLRLLDFGGGDGRFIHALDDAGAYDIMVYDPDPQAIEIARESFESNKNITYAISDEDVPNQTYEHIVFSNVFMILGSEALIEEVLLTLRSKKAANGRVYVGITHPCFLDRNFATFQNDYTTDRHKFNYTRDGEEYHVYMERQDTRIDIKDYGWSLSYVINSFLKCGFSILGIKEVPDITPNYFTPFMILILN